MEIQNSKSPAEKMNALNTIRNSINKVLNFIRNYFSEVPLLGWFIGALTAVLLEQLVGRLIALSLGLPKIPILFGFVTMLKHPYLIPSTILYMLIVYILPIVSIARLTVPITNWLAGKLLVLPIFISVIIHLGLLYLIMHLWSGISDYRVLMLKFTLIAVMVTLSLNVVNGYMGEFSCSHPGFMALGAYGASICTVVLFVDDSMFGPALLPPAIGPFMFPVALIVGGCLASVGAFLVAIPSFRTRGDYLAIVSLAFTFIVKSLIENLEIVGGSRGLSSQPNWANLPSIFICAVVCVWIINNFVRSTLGKALNAVRDDEMAANVMTVNTRRTKMTAFLFAAFWAGVAGGLLAHVLRYVNPGTFGLQKLAEVLAMVYFGGLNSIQGSILGAIGFNILSEALRPLAIYKWIIIPSMLILIMIFRPTGLLAFKEFDVKKIISPKQKQKKEVQNVIASN